MAGNLSPNDLGQAIERELTMYHRDVLNKVNKAGETAVKALVKKTKVTAPRLTGRFRKNIASKSEVGPRGSRHIWYVKAPDYRLTHLLVNGHAKAGGGRVEGDPFLQNALNEVLPEYEHAVEEAIQND